MQEDNHIFQGLRRDNHQIRQDSKFLWDAHNIRLTNREDSTLLSLTNEKGTSEELMTFQGFYVGHCVLGKYLVVFTANDDYSDNYIYRVEKIDNGYKTIILFHEGDVWEHGWNPNNPIEALGIYETEFVQKVYWVDGVNQPRMINIAKPELRIPLEYIEDGVNLQGPNYSQNPNADQYLHYTFPDGLYTKDSLDFVSVLQLEEKVEVAKVYGQGEFSPGTIQYAFSYYNKYERETNIFYTTPLYYISYVDRGGSPEDKIANSFKIEIDNLDKFDYLRIYSIHRTSIDAVPTVKVVQDLPIVKRTLKFIDTGTIGYTIDNSVLLYIGGESIVADCISHKDGTLFLGNIKINRLEIPNELLSYFAEREDDIHYSSRMVSGLASNSGKFYTHYSQIGLNKLAYFKGGEHYRLGLQFQHSSGKWSNPIMLKEDFTVPVISSDGTLNRPKVLGTSLVVPYFQYQKVANGFVWKEQGEPQTVIEKLKELGYKKVRGVVCFPNVSDRLILAQGMLCPTVFNFYNRENSGTYAQSSWFLRPNSVVAVSSNKNVNPHGTWAEFRHYHTLARNGSERAEIQSNDYANASSEARASIQTINDMLQDGYVELYKDEFLIDQSILTFHSPDIELSTELYQAIFDNVSLRLVGVIPFSSSIGDIDIQTSSPKFSDVGNGFVHQQRGTTDSEQSGKSLLSGNFYSDALVTKNSSGKAEGTDYAVGYMVYPWHRSGSLNSDFNRGSENGTRSAVLSKKKISNLKYSRDITWFSSLSEWTPPNGISTPQLWHGDDGELLKVNSHTYLGNVDQLLVRGQEYCIRSTETKENGVLWYPAYLGGRVSSDPIRMKYKSTPHAVFQLNPSEDGTENILPSIGSSVKTSVETVGKEQTISKPPEASPLHFWSAGGMDSFHTEVPPGYTGSLIGTYGLDGLNDRMVSQTTWAYPYIYKCDTVEGNSVKRATRKNDGYVKVGNVYSIYRNGKLYYIKCTQAFDNMAVFTNVSHLYQTDSEVEVPTNIPINQPTISESVFPEQQNVKDGFLYLAELYRTSSPANSFGGDKENSLWIPAGEPIDIDKVDDQDPDYWRVPFTYGDTYYQRYDCLKTYPYTQEDENQVVEIGSFMCETKVNIEGRYDRNRGQTSNLNMTPQNFNLLNEVYSQKDNFFNYRILDEDYYKQHTFANQITWSKEKHAGEEIDTWTNITLANTLDMDGEKGKVTALRTWNEYLLCFQEKALSQILFNSRVQIPTTDGVPIEISNGYKVDGSRLLSGNIGCSNKWATTTTTTGIYFLDSNTDSLYIFNGQLANLSEDRGMDWWVRQNHTNRLWQPILYGNGILNGMRAFYDNKYGDIYFTPGPTDATQPEALCYSEQLGQFTSFMSYGGTQAMFNFADGFYSLRETDGNVKLYQNNVGNYNSFYGTPKGWSFSFISNQDPTFTKIFDTIDLRTDHYWTYGTTGLLNTCPVSYIQADNEYQHSGTVAVDSRNMRKKFRVWRGLIPRNNGTRQRMRNPWTMITLGWEPVKPAPGTAVIVGTNDKKAVVHDVTVKYTV